MTAAPRDADRDPPRPGLGGLLAYLLLNLPVGIAGFVFLVTFTSVGIATAVVWVGVPVAALGVLAARGAARLERARIYALLDDHIPLPYRSLPDGGQRQRWKTRLGDSATWRDITYFLLLFPIGVAQFVIVVTAWSVSLGFAGLPLFYRYLPDGAFFFPSYDLRWITVDSELAALPWSALGVLFLAVSVALTRGMAAGHARFARALLGPTARRVRESEDALSQASTPAPVAG